MSHSAVSSGLIAWLLLRIVSDYSTIGDPNDRGTLSVAGFDTATPDLISQFAAGSV